MGNKHLSAGRRSTSASQDSAEFARRVAAARDRHNLSDIVGRHTTLKKRGARELVGLCCFHSERTPSLEVNDGKGTYYCHGCGSSGDAITFLMMKEGMGFMDALRALDGENFPVVSDEERAKHKAIDAASLAARIGEARAVYATSRPAPGTLAETYLRSRAITMPIPENVRFAMTPRWRDPDTGEVGRDYPAMLCAAQSEPGEIVGLQRIFLAPDGKGKLAVDKPKLSLGTIVGAAFRLGPPDTDKLIILEGPEDALSLAQEWPDRAIWCACGTALMPRIVIPAHVRSIVLAGDNNDAGRVAVAEATSAYANQGLAVSSIYPSEGFSDWNNQLRGIRS